MALVARSGAVAPEDSEQARRYSAAMARCLAALSKLSYCDVPPEDAGTALKEVCDNVCQWAGLELEPGSRLLGPSTHGDAQLDFGFVVKFKRGEEANEESLPAKGCIVVLRGAVDEGEDELPSITDIVAAPLALQAPHGGRRLGSRDRMEVWMSSSVCAGCKVSAAYKAAWDGLRPHVFDHLEDAECKPGAAVFVTGHSTGAALATLAMFSLQAEGGYHVQTSYHFESPRVGNKEFVAAFHKLFEMPVSIFRITHGADRVPREPRSSLGYSHVGFQIWYRRDNPSSAHVVCGDALTDPKCGVDGIPWNETCPLKQSECVNNTCAPSCKGYPPTGGPHCLNPLAPGKSFCGFDGNRTENWGSEWNEVLTSGMKWERSCSWGRAPTTTPAPTLTQTKTTTTTKVALNAKSSDAENVTVQRNATTTTVAQEQSKEEEPHTTAVPPTPKPTQPPPKLEVNPCFQADVAYQPLDMVGHYFSTESSASACQLRCAVISGCEHFSFFMLGESSGDCHVAGANAVRQNGSKGFIAGPRTCDVKKPQEAASIASDGFTQDPGWYTPGLAAAGTLFAYFSCMALLARTAQRRPSDARSAAAPPMSSTPFSPQTVATSPEAAIPMMAEPETPENSRG